MEKKKSNHGGARPGAGRKPKADEIAFITKLDNIIDSDKAIEQLKGLMDEGNFNAIKLYIEYRYGKPKETVENINHNIDLDLSTEEIRKIRDELKDKY